MDMQTDFQRDEVRLLQQEITGYVNQFKQMQHELDKALALVKQKQEDFESRIDKTLYDINVKLERISNLPLEMSAAIERIELQADNKIRDIIRLHTAECANLKNAIGDPSSKNTTYVVNGLFSLAGGLVTVILMMIKGYFEGKHP